MTAEQQLTERKLDAEIYATRDKVAEACSVAATSLGRFFKVSTTGDKVTVRIGKYIVVGVTLRPGSTGSVLVHAQVEHYQVRQTKLLFLIPLGPKTIIGSASYFKYLDSLERQLVAVDGGGGKVRQVGA